MATTEEELLRRQRERQQRERARAAAANTPRPPSGAYSAGESLRTGVGRGLTTGALAQSSQAELQNIGFRQIGRSIADFGRGVFGMDPVEREPFETPMTDRLDEYLDRGKPNTAAAGDATPEPTLPTPAPEPEPVGPPPPPTSQGPTTLAETSPTRVVTPPAPDRPPAAGGDRGSRSQTYDPQRGFEGVPEGYVEIIRGTDRSFARTNDQGGVGQEFRPIAGRSIQEAEEAAAFGDPNFIAQQEGRRADIEAAARETTAQAAVTNAIANSEVLRTNDNGDIVASFINPETGQFEDRVASPIIKELITSPDEYEIIEQTDPVTGKVTAKAVNLRNPEETIDIDLRDDLEIALQLQLDQVRQEGGDVDDFFEDLQDRFPNFDSSRLR
jgi:hypothetical protein